MVGEHGIDQENILGGYTMGLEVVNKAGFDCVGECGLDVKKEGGGYFPYTPGIFNFGCYQMHHVCGASAWPASELHGG